jgi:hypothetical protein
VGNAVHLIESPIPVKVFGWILSDQNLAGQRLTGVFPELSPVAIIAFTTDAFSIIIAKNRRGQKGPK